MKIVFFFMTSYFTLRKARKHKFWQCHCLDFICVISINFSFDDLKKRKGILQRFEVLIIENDVENFILKLTL